MTPARSIERNGAVPISAVDFRALFELAPGAFLVLIPDDPVFTIVAANEAYLSATLTRREQIVGRGLFEVFPGKPCDQSADGVRNLRASLQRAIATKAPDRMPVQRYDIRGHNDIVEERYWSPLNVPVADATGAVQYLIHTVEDVTERTLAEKRERIAIQGRLTSETCFRQLAETSTLGMILGDLEGRIFYMNPTVRELLGYSEEEVASDSVGWDRLTPPEFAAVDAEAARQIVATGRCVPYEKAYMAKDGRRVPILMRASLLDSVTGRAEVAAVVLDLTERKRSIERDAFLVRLDDALRPLAEPDAAMYTAAKLLCEYLQADRCTYCHLAADQETLDILCDYVRPGIPSMKGRYRLTQFGAGVAQMLRSNQACIAEDTEADPSLAEVRESYREGWVRAHTSVPLRKAGELVAIMAVHQTAPRRWRRDEVELVWLVADRSWEAVERTKVTRELRASEAQFRTLAETIPNLAWMAHRDGYIFWYNRRWYEYTGTEPAQMEGWGWQSVHDPSVLPQVMEYWKSCLASGEPFEMAFPLRGKDGAFRMFLTRGEPIKDDHGKVVRWFGTNTDITDQKRTEDELRRVNRELEEFAYVASHDLQEPLRMVNIYTQLILRRLPEDDQETSECGGFVRQGVARMEGLIRDLLAYSRTVHQDPLPVGEADLSTAFRDAVSVLQSRIEESGASIITPALPIVHGDTKQMGQVFQNLLSNALKYSRRDAAPEIRVSAELHGAEWIIQVHDNGIGFNPRYAQRIFGLFKRLHKDEYPGTGLGLAICQRIVERYGGRMWAEGRPGEGSTFSFALPRVEEI